MRVSDRPSSLLTPTQRERIADGFDTVDDAKRRRDERKVRRRIAAGVSDCELLADYPERQFDLAFADHDPERLRRELADAHRTLERIRVTNEIERDSVVATAREREQSGDGRPTEDENGSRDELVLRTRTDWRRELEGEIAEQYRPTRWRRLSDALLKLGTALLVVVSLMAVVVPEFTNGPGVSVGIVGAGLLVGGLLIVGLRSVKYDLIPAVRALCDSPRETIRRVWERV